MDYEFANLDNMITILKKKIVSFYYVVHNIEALFLLS